MEGLFFLVLCSLHVFLSSATRVPVLIGSTDKLSMQQSSLREGHVVPTKDFRRLADPFLQSELQCMVVFHDLKLSDFAIHGGAYSPDGHGSLFRHTKGLMEEAASLLSLPAVDSSETSPEDVLRALLRKESPSLHIQHLSPDQPEQIESLQYTPGTPTLWLVHLPAGNLADGRVSSLRKSDAIVGAIHSRLSTFSKYNFMVTSKTGEIVVEEEAFDHGSRAMPRRLLATDLQENGQKRCTLVCFSCDDWNTTKTNSNGTACSKPAVMMCFRKISLLFDQTGAKPQILDASDNLTEMVLSQEVIGCPVEQGERLSVSMSLSSKNPNVTVNAELEFHFQLTKGTPVFNNSANASYWEMVTVTVKYTNYSEGSRCLFPPSLDYWVYAPVNQSYNCFPSTNWSMPAKNFRYANNDTFVKYQNQFCPPTGDSNATVIMSMDGLQVQAYAFSKPNGPYFDYAADCMGYFTGTTWMGIIVGSFLMIVIFLATLAFLATDTPDRFDDPKGKNIQVQ